MKLHAGHDITYAIFGRQSCALHVFDDGSVARDLPSTYFVSEDAAPDIYCNTCSVVLDHTLGTKDFQP